MPILAGLVLALCLVYLLRSVLPGPPNILLLVHTGPADAGFAGMAPASPLADLAARGAFFANHELGDDPAMQAAILGSAAPVALPALLSSAGYRSRHVGNWYLEEGDGGGKPGALGFQSYRAVQIRGATGYDAQALDDAILFMEQGADGQPWFLTYWAGAPGDRGGLHSPPLEVVLAEILSARLPENTLLAVIAPTNPGQPGGLGVVFYWPGELEPGPVITEQVRFVDYLPTLAAIAGVPVPAGIHGRNLFE